MVPRLDQDSIVGGSVVPSVSGDPRRKNASLWKPLPDLRTPRQDAAVAVLPNNRVVVAGGRNAQESSLKEVELLEWSVQRRWWTLPPLQIPRCGGALVALGSRRLYMLGGTSTNASVEASMETYEMAGPVDAWETVPEPMSTPRMYPGAVSLNNGTLFVAGGRNAQFQELDTCELFTVETGKWEGVLSMSTPRFACMLVYLPSLQCVLAMGGYNGQEWTLSCELYDPAEDSWTEWPYMTQAVQFGTATVLSTTSEEGEEEEYVMVRGQPLDSEDAAAAVWQCYSVSTQEWVVLPPNYYSNERTGASICCLDKSRVLVLGGGTGDDLEATRTCRFWMVPPHKLFSGDAADLASVANMSVANSEVPPRPPRHPTGQPQAYPMSPQPTTTTTAASPPFASSGASVASGSTGAGSASRRKVENAVINDASGVKVSFTGFVNSETGRPQGKGRMTWPLTGDRYEGRFENGMRSGRGHMMYNNGDSYVGYFENDHRQGKGQYAYRDGRIYEGFYNHDYPEDTEGMMKWKDGTIYVGSFQRGKRTGRGKITFPQSQVEYEGDFVKGKYHGKHGRCRFADGSVYVGNWMHGKAHGFGKLTDAQGNIVHDGRWANDGPVFQK